MSLEFRLLESSSTFLHPGKGFEPVTVGFQVRFDPLTGRSGHFSHFGAIKAQELDMEQYGSPEVKGFCPFCLDHREAYTPRFSGTLVPEEGLSRGESVLIPNLFPYDIHSGIVIMTDDHLVPVEALDQTRVINALSLGTDFLKRVASIDPSLRYHVGAWNYMPPSGGGLVHPHQQYFATNNPGNQFMDELNGSRVFQQEHGANYWSELVREEQKREERYIASTGSIDWLCAFVSLGILGDIIAIIPDCFSISDVTDRIIADLSCGLLKVLDYFRSVGIASFNAAWFFGPPGQSCFSSHFRVIPRTFLNTRDFAPDMNFFQTLLSETVSVITPEQLCSAVRPFFAAP